MAGRRDDRAREPHDVGRGAADEHIDLPGELYEFFADEVYRGLEPDVRNGLGLQRPPRASTASSPSSSLGPSAPRGSAVRL